MRQRDLSTRRDHDATTGQEHRLVDGLLGGLAVGMAALLIARPERYQEPSLAAHEGIVEYEIGAGSAWGVGG